MSLYDEVLKIVQEYTGIGAELFLARRCKRLGLSDPQAIQQQHLTDLGQGIAVTAGAYMSEERVQEFIRAILHLSGTYSDEGDGKN